MNSKFSWVIILVVVALLTTACGPEMTTPTSQVEAPSATAADTDVPQPTAIEAEPPAELPVDPDDWHVLGEPDAPVTIVEYSDFQ